MINLKVSVILPYFNGKEFVKEAIDSVLGQSYLDLELLVIDDGSVSQTDTIYLKDLVGSYHDDRLRYFYTVNSGLSKTRNLGISHSAAPYIAFIDQDDYWRKDKLQQQIDVLRGNSKAQLVFTDCVLFGENNKIYPLTHIRLHKRNTSKQEMRLNLECLDVLIRRNLPGLQHKAMASRQFLKLIFSIMLLWLSKLWSNAMQHKGLN